VAGLPERRPLLCDVTDRRSVAEGNLLPVVERAVAAGVDLIQIREKDLETRALLALVEAAMARARGTVTRILVNDRLDAALTARADGVHLPGHGFPVAAVRRAYPELLIGASCHDLDELRAAEAGGADFAVFGPVFAPLSKAGERPPVGVGKLGEAARAVKIPVLALGGVTVENAAECWRVDVAGVAGITLFQKSSDLGGTIARLRELGQKR
jgi:thiamine-phosphate pyrophosphorylase